MLRARVNTCPHTKATRSDSHSSLAVAFYLPHFLLCLLEGFLRRSSFLFFLSDGSQSSFPTESSTASGMARRAESNSLVTLVDVPSRGPANGINGQSGWQVKFSPEFNSMAPLNSWRLKSSREKDFVDKRRVSIAMVSSGFRPFPYGAYATYALARLIRLL